MHPRSRAFAFLITAGILAVAASAVAFAAQASHRTSSAAVPKRGGSITIARIEDSQSFDKTNVFQNESIWLAEQIMEPLYTVAPDGKTLKPWLATSYTESKDGKTYTFKLRQGVKFSNGKPMTSADVKFSIDDARVADEGLGLPRRGDQEHHDARPEHRGLPPEVPRGRRSSPTSRLFANGIIPNNFAGQTRTQFYKHPIGTGPVHVGQARRRPVGDVEAQPVLLAEGQAVPRLRHVDVRHRRQHARAAAARRPDPGRRVPAVQLDQQAARARRA